jgi:hypothetical protein
MNDEFNWTECTVIRANGYRLIDEAPNYAIGRTGHVWRLPTLSPGKGGSIRLLKAHQLTPDKGRVKLRHNGETVPYSVNGLHQKYYPEAYEVRLPRVEFLGPDRLVWFELLMREDPAGTAWGAGDYSPGCHGFAARGSFLRPAIHIPSALYVRWTSDRLSRGIPADGIGQDRDRTGQLLGEALGQASAS